MASLHRRPRSKYWHAAWRDARGKLHMRSTKEIRREKAWEIARGWEHVERNASNEAQVRKVMMYRLSQSEHAANFVLKGAMMFLVWTGAQYRATKDMDLLALKSASVERLRDIFRELCELPVAQDGLTFEPDSVKAEEIREDNLYQGVRVTLVARLGNPLKQTQWKAFVRRSRLKLATEGLEQVVV